MWQDIQESMQYEGSLSYAYIIKTLLVRNLPQIVHLVRKFEKTLVDDAQ